MLVKPTEPDDPPANGFGMPVHHEPNLMVAISAIFGMKATIRLIYGMKATIRWKSAR